MSARGARPIGAGLAMALVVLVLRLLLASGAVSLALLVTSLPEIRAEAQSFAVSRIVVKGNERVDEATVRAYLGLKTGKSYSAAEIDAAYQRLVQSGLFEQVDISPRGGTLIVTVKEYPLVNRVSIEGNRKLKDEDLIKLVGLKPRLVYNPAQAEADAAAILDAYRQAGRHDAIVRPRIIPREGNRVDVVFEIDEGDVIEIERIGFVGNKAFSDRRLRRVLASKQAGILRRLIRADNFLPDRLEFDRQLLTDFYHSRGYIDFKVVSITPEFSRARDAFFLTIKVQEGQQYRFGKIEVTSSLPDIDPAPFEKVARLRSGKIYSPVLIEKAIERMERLASDKGLSFVRVTPRIRRNDDTRTLDLTLVLERGPRVFVERIDISGNTTTLDKVIRRQFRFAEGDPFNPREIARAAERIRALGYFSSVDVSTRPGSTSEDVIVDVKVEEQPTGSLTFGVSYSTSSGVGTTIKLTEDNFLGRGQKLVLDAGFGVSDQNYTFSFVEPAFLDRDLEAGIAANYYTTKHFAEPFDRRILSFNPSIAFPASLYGRISLGYRFQKVDLTNIDAGASAYITAEPASVTSSAILASYSYDTRGRGYDPSRGVRLRFSGEFAGIGGSRNYIKATGLVGGQVRTFGEDVTLSADLEFGAVKALSGRSHITERFFLNGGRMRGFQRNGIGPRDPGTGDALGGNFFAVARFEAQFPIGLPEEYGINGGAFVDVGSVWGLDGTLPAGTDASAQLRATAGFSIFWKTPIGPLRFNFMRPLKTLSYDKTQSFELTIQSAF